MKVAERVAALEALLGRVRRNAALGRGNAPSPEEGAENQRVDAQPEAHAGERAPALPLAVAPPPSYADFGDWSSLLERDLRDPSPASTPPPPSTAALLQPRASRPPELEAPAVEPPSIPAPPIPGPPRLPTPIAAPSIELPASGSPLSVEERAPESELERAIREVADNPPSTDPRALWDEAMELRGRRPASPPAREVAAESTKVTEAASVPQAKGPDSAAVGALLPTPHAHRGMEPARRRRRARHEPPKRVATRAWMVALFVLAAAAVAWATLVRDRRPVAIAITPSASSPLVRSAPALPQPTAPTAIEPLRAAPSATSAVASAPSATPPSTLRSPRDHGWLRVELEDPVDVYLQGVRAGESGRWNEVPCGMKNARMARPGNPPPGHSFPMWLGQARTIRVPCGGEVLVRWSLD